MIVVRNRSALVALAALCLIATVFTQPSLAQQNSAASSTATVTPAQAGALAAAATSSPQDSSSGSTASKLLSKLQVHGFLTQAWVTANFADGGFVPPPNGDERLLGIPEDGTTNYRTMAIQFRYEIDRSNILVMQLSSRALGTSPIQDVEDDIELDWAFYERRIGNNTSLKIGRSAVPFGIFNEVRDVGTILPFYRPSFAYYREGAFTAERIDGFVLSHNFLTQSDWSFDLDVYFGGWDLVEDEPRIMDGPQTAIARADDAFGFQFWANTPLTGLRFGLGGRIYEVSEGLEGFFRQPGEKTDFEDWYLAIDGVFDKFVARAEYRELKGDRTIPVAGGSNTISPYYIQLGYHPTEKIRIYLQSEFVDVTFQSPIFTRDIETEFRRDDGIAFNYVFSPNLVFKAEYHQYETEQFQLIPTSPFGPPFDHRTRIADDGSYTIISLSASF